MAVAEKINGTIRTVVPTMNPALVDYVAAWEGFSAQPYLCPAGHYTIGYGRTTEKDGSPVTERSPVTTEANEREWLRRRLQSDRARIVELIGEPAFDMLPHELDAVTSFVFNVGLGNFQRSTLLKKLRKGDLEGAAREILRWNKGRINGKLQRIRGLTLRRADERELFEHGDYQRGPRDLAPAEPRGDDVGAEPTGETSEFVSILAGSASALAAAFQQLGDAWARLEAGIPEAAVPIVLGVLAGAIGVGLGQRAWAYWRQHRGSPS